MLVFNSVWMSFDRAFDPTTNHVHERDLRIVYKVKIHDFGLLLEQRNSVSVHKRSITNEIYKNKIRSKSPFMKGIFKK